MATLISENPSFIFIHIVKTAGTSMTAALNRCVQVPPRCLHHETAQEVRALVTEEYFQRAFKFCFVRNPWDWMVSLYSYVSTAQDHPNHLVVRNLTFAEFVPWQFDYWTRDVGQVRTQKSWISDEQGNILVDMIGRFESLEQDYARICTRLGILANLPRINVSFRRPYRNYYDSVTRERVAAVMSEDIEQFGYEF